MKKISIIASICCLPGLLSVLAEAPLLPDKAAEDAYPLSLPPAAQPMDPSHTAFAVQLHHPGSESRDPQECMLFQVTGANGLPEAYYMSVDSVFCREGDCAVISVRIFWDELGFYDRYELAPGTSLEKREGKPFTNDDYRKLHTILMDRDSPYKSVNIHNVLDTTEVDGVSGATVTLDEADTVKGAAWTCYTLWHWANGEVVDWIRENTGQALSLTDIQEYLAAADPERKLFALRQMVHRRAYDSTTISAVISQHSPHDGNQASLALQYLKNAPEDVYFPLLDALFASANSRSRTQLLNAFLESSHTASPAFLDKFCRYLPRLESYYEIHLFLDLMKSRNPQSKEVVRQALPLLDNDSFLIARKAYWFLKEYVLAPEQAARLSAFRESYSDRL